MDWNSNVASVRWQNSLYYIILPPVTRKNRNKKSINSTRKITGSPFIFMLCKLRKIKNVVQ